MAAIGHSNARLGATMSPRPSVNELGYAPAQRGRSARESLRITLLALYVSAVWLAFVASPGLTRVGSVCALCGRVTTCRELKIGRRYYTLRFGASPPETLLAWN